MNPPRRFRWWVVLLTLSLDLLLLFPTTIHSQDHTPSQTLQSDSPRVLQGGSWVSQSADAASGSSYLYSSGSPIDVLALAFSGAALEVMYVAGPRLGTLAIEVDGTVLRTVITTTDQTAYAQSARIDYLDTGPHTVRVYAQEGGIIAIDAFIIHAHPTPPVASQPDTTLAVDDEGGIHASVCAPQNATHRVSITYTGAQATGDSFNPAVSASGRYVAFDSRASLVPNDEDMVSDIYVYDRQTCTIEMVSVSSTGVKGNGASSFPTLSGDGRYVAFSSDATNLVSGDGNGAGDVFVHDRQTRQTTRVSVMTGGGQANGMSSESAISGDGRFVAFESSATNLVGSDTNGQTDIFVHDRQTATTTRVSVVTGGTEATGGYSFSPAISADGRYVAFVSEANNLVVGDTNNRTDIFVHDRQTATTTRVSVLTGGGQADEGSYESAISGDGRFVAFLSIATNLVSGDTNATGDVFVHDRQTATTTRVSVTSTGNQAGGSSAYPRLSADGRYVTFESSATNLVVGDTNGTSDIFVHDRQTATTTRVSVGNIVLQGNADALRSNISADGRYVVFMSTASTLVAGDTNGQWDVFVAPRVQPAPDSLALFNPPFQFVGLLSTLADNPPASAYTAFSAYAPVSGGTWVMGDWNGDGMDSPGVYRDGAFYFTNRSGESLTADWRGLWIGILGPVVSGRFSNAANDCVGAVDSAPYGSMTIFALYFTCDLSGTTTTPAISFQWLSAPLPDPTFTGTFQFMAGDFNGDGLDSVAVRRNEFIAYGSVNPAAGPAIYDLAQYIGAPGTGDNGSFVVGDWDGNGLDSFGLYYQNGEFFYRNDLDFNSGVYLNQSVGTPFGNTGVQAATWK